MLTLSELTEKLGYRNSNYYRENVSQFEAETAHLFRDAQKTHVNGVYTFQTWFTKDKTVHKLAVFVATANNQEEAKDIHKNLWNLAVAPIIIILTPSNILIYTGFDYSINNSSVGLLEKFGLDDNSIRKLLVNFSAQAIDSRQIWQGEYSNFLKIESHVHNRLLRSLKTLDAVLQEQGLAANIAHNLIGKYVYIRYLRDRGILSDSWLAENKIQIKDVLGHNAKTQSLAQLSEILETRFNGKIFPINFAADKTPKDNHVALTASIFNGDEIINYDGKTRNLLIQLHLDFQAYDFRYIPVETLSAVYEQFIEDPTLGGAVYTPEELADYLISEVNTVKPLTKDTKVCDPACGSGIFLVLTYRRLIEQYIREHSYNKPNPENLKELLSNIYGVEKELDACYITEFSLILTV